MRVSLPSDRVVASTECGLSSEGPFEQHFSCMLFGWDAPAADAGGASDWKAGDRGVGVKFDSPLRYPGGKAALAPFLTETIALNGVSNCAYFEPFAGGAGAALRLLRKGIVSEAYINDLDPCVAAFWRAALGEPNRFSDAIMSVRLDVGEWKRQRAIYLSQDASKPFDLGFATFYLNRCNRSGVLFGAAPIGGYEQIGKWKIDARFYRESLAERVTELGRLSERIHLSNMDAHRFLLEKLPRGRGRARVFTYLDPPYWEKGNRLYFNSYSSQDHRALARYMQSQKALKWVMSYDDSPLIWDIYTRSNIRRLSLRYNLNRARDAQELLIAPDHLQLPGPHHRKGAQAWTTT